SAAPAHRDPQRRARHSAHRSRTRGPATYRRRKIEQGNCLGTRSQREHRLGPPRQHHGASGNSQNRGAGGLCNSKRAGESAVKRRSFLESGTALALGSLFPLHAIAANAPGEALFQLKDVTSQAGIDFRHNSGAYGGKFLPETMGSGCAFLDYDSDGYQDILLVNSMDWPGHKRGRSTLKLYKNNRNG